MTTYVDASVLMRLVLGEDQPLADWDRIVPLSSEIIRVECLRAIERYRWTTALDPSVLAERRAAVLTLLSSFQLATVSRAVLERAADPFPTYVASLDAIHLATAVIVREEMPNLDFATHDLRLATAARSVGFAVSGV